MSANGAAQPARDPGAQPPPRRGSRRPARTANNPSPLDTLFILFASGFFLLLLLWIASQLLGTHLFTQLPEWVTGAIQGIWSKVILGAGSAGILALRKWLDKSRPAPNYLLWIPGFTIFFAATLALILLLIKLFAPPAPPSLSSLTHYHLPIRFSAQPLQSDVRTNDAKEISFRTTLPEKALRPVYIPLDHPEEAGLYSYDVDVPGSGVFQAEIIHRAIQSRLVGSALHDYEYLLCVKNNPKKPFPADFSADRTVPLLKISCSLDQNSNDTRCISSDQGSGYLMSCDDRIAENRGIIPVVYAAEAPDQGREPGWVVPSLDTLNKMTDRERVGYTRFDVSFTATGAAANAERYYYALLVNEKPIFIDGLRPEKTIYQLQKGRTNWISFGLENLNFTGQYEGYEKLRVDVVFLNDKDQVIQRQELEREYIALRSADEVVSNTPVGTFHWKGTYVPPKNENKYEILLASANCGDPVDRECINRTMNAKNQFDKTGLKYRAQPIVMVVRPPLRKPPSYGLALGVVQPTSQVQFTFNAEEAAQLCSWAVQQIGQSRGGSLIQGNLRRYEVATRGYSPCGTGS